MRGEFVWIEALRRRVAAGAAATVGEAEHRPCVRTERAAGKPEAPDVVRGTVRVGIGDDAAVLSVPEGHELLLTTDLLVEGVHFERAGLRPESLGWKALAVSVSDIAAMGGRSAHAVVSVALRDGESDAFADGLLAGLLECAARYGVAIVGGDTTASPGPVVVNVALTGFVPAGRAVLRSGARPGDLLCVTGALGGSILGRHLRVVPRQDEALLLVQGCEVHAMIDLSDGLSSDLGHLLDESRVGAEIWDDRIPVHDDARALAARDGRPALDHALDDGEDYELLFAVEEGVARRLAGEGLGGTRVTPVGRVVPPGRYVRLPHEGSDAARPVERRGYDAFRRT